jgi:spore maturation protein CgeB
MKRTDIEQEVKKFKSKSKPDDRYTSFDYCYNYFRTTKDLTKDVEKSSLTLGFYLASWGMYRGSSFLLQKSVKHFQPTIQYISTLDNSVWEIDVDKYDEQNIHTIIKIYNGIKDRLILKGNADLTLITKILLGVFGFVPAFDNFFCNTFRVIADGQCGFRRVNPYSLNFVKTFYVANQRTIDKLSKQTFTTNFVTGKKTTINYPKAKIIDMYGFTVGQ